MDSEKFKIAQARYDAGDWRAAARGFLESTETGTPIGNGAAYHLAGNSFMRLKRYADAVTVYEHALRDDTYLRRSAVESNLANAYLKLGDYTLAVAHYEAALEEPDCKTPHKCYQGMGLALMEQEEFERAALAYRRAAVCQDNPEVGRSLVNLGIALMALDRPANAVEAYKAALGSESYKNRGLALQNLGLAYFNLSEYSRAIRNFEEAVALHGYELSPAAQQALESSRAAALAFAEDGPADSQLDSAQVPPLEEVLDVSTTSGQGASIAPEIDTDPSLKESAISPQVDTGVISVLAADLAGQPTDTFDSVAQKQNEELPYEIGGKEDVDSFFSRSEDEMRKMNKEALRENRKPFGWLKGFLVFIVIGALLAGGLYAAYYTGFSIPSSQEVVSKTLSSYNEGKPYESYWMTADDMVRQMAAIPVPSTFSVQDVQVDGMRAIVNASATPKDGTALGFKFSLERDGISWKIVGIEPVF